MILGRLAATDGPALVKAPGRPSGEPMFDIVRRAGETTPSGCPPVRGGALNTTGPVPPGEPETRLPRPPVGTPDAGGSDLPGEAAVTPGAPRGAGCRGTRGDAAGLVPEGALPAGLVLAAVLAA